jgi:hypothetical protein
LSFKYISYVSSFLNLQQKVIPCSGWRNTRSDSRIKWNTWFCKRIEILYQFCLSCFWNKHLHAHYLPLFPSRQCWNAFCIVVSRHIVLCPDILCCVQTYCVVSRHIVLCPDILCGVQTYCVVSRHIVLCPDILCGVQTYCVVSRHIVLCFFVLLVVVLCIICCQFLWIVHFWLPLRYYLTFILCNVL